MLRQPNPRKDLNTLRADVERLHSDMGDLNESLHHLASNQAHRAGNAIQAEARGGRDRVYRRAREVKDRGLQARDDMGEGLAERPFSTALVAFGIGCAVATIFTTARRISRHRQRGEPHVVSEEELDGM